MNIHEIETTDSTTILSRKRLWAARILGGLPVAFLLLDAGMKLVQADAAVKGTVQLGYPPGVLMRLGLVLLACIAAYVFPPTAVLGAVLLTGYLGGAVASHVRVGDPLLTHVLAPIYFAALLWGALALRGRLRGVIPFARAPRAASSAWQTAGRGSDARTDAGWHGRAGASRFAGR